MAESSSRTAGRTPRGRPSARSLAVLAQHVLAALALLETSTTSAAAPPTPPLASCVVRLTSADPWTAPGGRAAAFWQLEVASTAPDPVPAPWTLAVSAPRPATLTAAWNLQAPAEGGEGASNGTASTTITGHAPAFWQALPPRGEGAARVGLVVSYEKGAGPARLLPSGAALNGAPCALVTGAAALEPAPQHLLLPGPPSRPPGGDGEDAAATADGGTTTTSPPVPPGMTTKDGEVLGPDGKPIFFTGVNWFGFEVGATGDKARDREKEAGRGARGGAGRCVREVRARSTRPPPLSSQQPSTACGAAPTPWPRTSPPSSGA